MADPDKPLASLSETEKKIDPPKNEFRKEPEPEPEPEPENDVAARRRAFEDKHLGHDAVRINGQVERGVGSLYSRLSDARKREYDALERAAQTEARLAEAHTALVAADAEHEAAMAALDAAEAEPDAPAAE
jgi:hypothetical protein